MVNVGKLKSGTLAGQHVSPGSDYEIFPAPRRWILRNGLSRVEMKQILVSYCYLQDGYRR